MECAGRHAAFGHTVPARQGRQQAGPDAVRRDRAIRSRWETRDSSPRRDCLCRVSLKASARAGAFIEPVDARVLSAYPVVLDDALGAQGHLGRRLLIFGNHTCDQVSCPVSAILLPCLIDEAVAAGCMRNLARLRDGPEGPFPTRHAKPRVGSASGVMRQGRS